MRVIPGQAGDPENRMRAGPAGVVVSDIAFDQERVRRVRKGDVGESWVVAQRQDGDGAGPG
jgi:hypothetical protein